MDELGEVYRADAARMQATFDTRRPLQTVTTEWRLGDPSFRRDCEAMVEQGRGADLILAS